MRRILTSALAAALIVIAVPLGQPAQAAPRKATVTVIQAVPGSEVDVSIDGRVMARQASVGDMLGPFELTPGEHEVEFTGPGGLDVESTLTVAAGGSSDVVLHLPAEAGGAPVVHSYAVPTEAIGPEKARVILAHTATVAPADVQVNGEIVFTNIANGEFAEADVPAGTHEVALFPAGTTKDAILGPLEVPLEARTLSMIYAYGNPRDGSMNVIAHTTTLEPDGNVAPTRIDTGSAGLMHDPVAAFGVPGTSDGSWSLVLVGLFLVGAVGLVAPRRRSRRDPATLPPR